MHAWYGPQVPAWYIKRVHLSDVMLYQTDRRMKAALDLLVINDKQGSYPDSFYAASIDPPPHHPAHQGHTQCDVCVVGAGYTGLSAALHLARAGRSVCVVEAHRIGWGASGRNGGQLGSGQRRNQWELEDMLGPHRARQMWELGEQAKACVKGLIERYKISCDYQTGIIYADHKARFAAQSRRYADHLSKTYNYYEIECLERAELNALVGSPRYFGGVIDRGAGHLQPLKFALGLARAAQSEGACLFENSRVLEIKPQKRPVVITKDGELSCETLVLGCNGYLGDLGLPITAPCVKEIMPINNFIVVSEGLSNSFAKTILDCNHAVADSRFVVNYFKMVQAGQDQSKRLVFGGGEIYGYRFPRDVKQFVRRPLLHIFPQMKDVRLDYGWGGTLAITTRRLPNFQRLTPQIYAASGYCGHGVGMATLAGSILADQICGDSERFDLVAKLPHQNFPGGAFLRWPLLVLAMSYYALRDRM